VGPCLGTCPVFFLFFFPLTIFSSLFYVSLSSLASSSLTFSFQIIFHFSVFLFSSPILPHSLSWSSKF
jgi:hypothetical protein